MPSLISSQFAFRRKGAGILALAMLLGLSSPSSADVTPDQAAEMLLTSARRAYNEKNFSFAADRFREFLQKFGNHKEAVAARYGLALALIDGPKDYNAALEQLQAISANKDFADHAGVLYHLGLAKRGQGLKELAEAVAKPNEAPQRREAGRLRFEEASQQFAAALIAFSAKAKELPKADKDLSPEWEWVARNRCDLAEMQMRAGKVIEARATAEPFMKDPLFAKSQYCDLGRYYHGSASFLLKDFPVAFKSLNVLTPFQQPGFGTHARYLVARIHHVQDERAEAARDYEGVIADYGKEKLAAREALKQPDKFKDHPEEKDRLTELEREPTPEHVARASFYLGVLLYENGKYAEALTHLADFIKLYPLSPLTAEAQLRQGFCQAQLKQFAEAQKTLQPLVDKHPNLADQALLWIAKAQIGAADPNNAQIHEQAVKTAIDTLRRAADKAQQIINSDADAKSRKGDILLELGDIQQTIRQYREAAGTYNQILNEKTSPPRDEETVERLVTSLHLAGDFVESDKACDRFVKDFPKSTLLSGVLFRHAENAYFTALAAEKNPNFPNRPVELPKLFDEASKRYQTILAKFPESDHVNLARYSLAMTLYRKGNVEKARGLLEAIPVTERTDALALVPYVLADCLMRLAPVKADDALAAGKMEEELKGAVELLDGFLASQPGGPQSPDALLKLGFCHMRLASLFAQKEDKDKSLASARGAFEKLMGQFPQSASFAQGVFERAKCLGQQNDVNAAINEMRRFQGDPLKQAAIAPMALLQLATYLRSQNKAGEAAEVLQKARQDHEARLNLDPARSNWVALLQYHHGVALREAGKLPEARAVFDLVVKQAANRPEAVEAALRLGQCFKDEGSRKVEAARTRLATPNLKPEEIAVAKRDLDSGLKDLRDAVAYFDQQAEQLKQKEPVPDARARMLYEAAWASRAVAEVEVKTTREKIQEERWQKLKEEGVRSTPAGKPTPVIPRPEVSLTMVPVQPAETKARAEYRALMDSFPDAPLAVDARFELSEMLAERNEFEPAVKLLKDALDKEPPLLTAKIRLRLGACLQSQGDVKSALGHFLAVAQDPKNPLAGQALYRAGECQIQKGEWAEAVKHLAVFRDQQPFQNLPGLTDRALLRLGFALGKLNQWDPSRQSYEQVVGRFANSPWILEARYGIGWSWQNQKNYDNAVNAYNDVTKATVTELGARAQLQIGLCRLEQKRLVEAANALLIVHTTYDYPELNAIALCEAARCYLEDKKPVEAERLLERVIKDHPGSKWADVAKERLAALKKG